MELTDKRINEIHNELRRKKSELKGEQSFIELLTSRINEKVENVNDLVSYTGTLEFTNSINIMKKQIKSSEKRCKRLKVIIESLEFTLKYMGK